MRRLGTLLMLAALVAAPSLALAAGGAGTGQGLFDGASTPLASPGWAGFLDMKFMADSVGALGLAIVLGAVIAFHPMTPRTVDTLSEADLPKVHIMYAFIGAVIGLTVREFGMVIGVVVFGIGGLLRFRTDAGSARDTGRLIAVTLSGLVAGLGLPHLAVITTAVAFVLILLFDAHVSCRVKVDQLPKGRLGESADAYRAVLIAQGCRLITERKSFGKEKLEFVFRLPRTGTRERVHAALCEIAPELRGEVDWEVE